MKIRLAMYEALKAIDVPEPKIEAVIQAMEPALPHLRQLNSIPTLHNFGQRYLSLR
ncbi:hypothetical protein THH46_04380 [Pseudomonas sp. NA13]